MSLLRVQNLHVRFPVRRGMFAPRESIKAVNNVSFELAPGETLGLVGESGSGKSTLARAILRLIPVTDGRIHLESTEITHLSRQELRPLRRQFQMIFQDPVSSLNPRLTVGHSIGEALDIHNLSPDKQSRRQRIAELLQQVGLDADHASRYPHQFSGGQRQRIGIARALAVEPRLIVCDEPVSALDVSVQAQIINLLTGLQKRLGLAFLFISHDLAVVEHISQRILVMYLGRVVEHGPARQVTARPAHPYTRELVSAVPKLRPDSPALPPELRGEIPSPLHPPSGCPFRTRCPLAQPVCAEEEPPFHETVPGQYAACHFADGRPAES